MVTFGGPKRDQTRAGRLLAGSSRAAPELPPSVPKLNSASGILFAAGPRLWAPGEVPDGRFLSDIPQRRHYEATATGHEMALDLVYGADNLCKSS